MYLKQISEVQAANIASKHHSELLRLPYFDIIEYHVVDPVHIMLLGTGMHMMNIWKEEGILKNKDFKLIQKMWIV